jgi:UDP-N-acetylmuramoyl-tripeptide--D-alanyl-D-alanine ligase
LNLELLSLPKSLYVSKTEFIGEAILVSDTRKLKQGDIFIGIKGDRFDGNDFFIKAIELGAKVLILQSETSRDEKVKEYIKNYKDISLILVENSINYLQELSKLHLKKWRNGNKKVIAITGSNGKTTTKEMIAYLLSKVLGDKLHFTKGNLNNHLGLPFTILELKDEHELALFEIGTNHFGEIKSLCEICDPDYGIITNIGSSHLEFLENEQGVFKEKSDLFHWIKNKGVKSSFILNIDDPYLKTLEHDPISITSGQSSQDFNWKCFDDHLEGFAKIENPNLIGKHNYKNLSMALSLSMTLFPKHKSTFIEAAHSFIPQSNRSSWLNYKNKKVFLDAYNANPSSMEASLISYLAFLIKNKIDLNKVLFVIGDMYELGEITSSAHKNIGHLLKDQKVVNAFFVGQFSQYYLEGFGSAGKTFSSVDDILKDWQNMIDQYEHIYVKASRGVGLEKLFKNEQPALQA